ncbi:hypothetical protein PM082_002548 [Marasmius tenuissimus]|nr:hypothetical protein PM082_002548 [Marasmius tenuissimus]
MELNGVFRGDFCLSAHLVTAQGLFCPGSQPERDPKTSFCRSPEIPPRNSIVPVWLWSLNIHADIFVHQIRNTFGGNSLRFAVSPAGTRLGHSDQDLWRHSSFFAYCHFGELFSTSGVYRKEDNMANGIGTVFVRSSGTSDRLAYEYYEFCRLRFACRPDSATN